MDDEKREGLSSKEAMQRLAQHGPNIIFRAAGISFWRIARHEVTEPMILLLLTVGVFYSLWGKWEDGVTIFAVILLLVLAEVYNEYRAKKTIASLEKIAASKTRVFRDGAISEVPAEEIVPGDVLVLTAGTEVAADARVDRSVGIKADESSLTGESFPADKSKTDEVYAGTTIVSGEGRATVTATGKDTRLGKIADTLNTVRPPRTPLQTAMRTLAGRLVYIAVFFSVLIPALGVLRGQDLKTMVLTGLSLSFATIPEELPIIITMVLGLGAYRLSKEKFLVKRIKAAEVMGNATVIVTDKTGTITEGKMKIAAVLPAGREREVIEKALGSISEYILLPMESEIRNRAAEAGYHGTLPPAFRQRNLTENDRKTKAVIRESDGKYELFVSGAPEEVFDACGGISDSMTEELLKETRRGRRVIAVASRTLGPGEEVLDFHLIEHTMDLDGLISFEDAPREGVRETISVAAGAGIRTIMVTGDHSLTALFIAREVGIPADNILTGPEIDKLTDEGLKEAVTSVSVFSRTTPKHKFRIVRALQDNGEIVAVTGDGINDVLALKGADIGIAMGIRGTDVAKDAAEAVLADDNYITITRGIFEGRTFFDNLRKGIKYYLSVKTALIMIFLLPVLVGVPMPFSPIQIIILELFMDLAASAGFVSEPAEKNIYRRPPRHPGESVISPNVMREIFLGGSILFLSVMVLYFYARWVNLTLGQTQTFAFSAWIFAHVALAFVSRSEREPVIRKGVFSNRVIDLWAVAAVAFLCLGIYSPLLRDRFSLAFIAPAQLLLIGVVSVSVVGLVELRKRFKPNAA